MVLFFQPGGAPAEKEQLEGVNQPADSQLKVRQLQKDRTSLFLQS